MTATDMKANEAVVSRSDTPDGCKGVQIDSSLDIHEDGGYIHRKKPDKNVSRNPSKKRTPIKP